MNQTRNVPARMAFVLALVVFALLGAPQAARAQWIVQGDTIPAGDVIDDDVILYGTDVTVDGTVNGDVVAIGTTVTINGTVSGSLVAVGRLVSMNGGIGGSVYVAGGTLRLGSASQVRHNVHFGGLLLDSARGSKIGRDLVAASVRASIGSEIGRGLNAIIAMLSFHGKIGLPLDQEPSGQQGNPQPEAVKPASNLLFVSLGGQKVAGYAVPMREPIFQEDADDGGMIVPEWLVVRLGELTALILLGGLVVWLLRDWLFLSTSELRDKPFPAAGYGIAAAIIFANGLGIALLAGAMLVGAGLLLGSITLWELAFLFWGIGFSFLVLAASLFALAVFYGSKIVVAYLVGALILERLAPRVANYRMATLLLGLAIYVVLRMIPHAGWIIEIIVIVLGLGAIWLALAHRHRLTKENTTSQELVLPDLAAADATPFQTPPAAKPVQQSASPQVSAQG